MLANCIHKVSESSQHLPSFHSMVFFIKRYGLCYFILYSNQTVDFYLIKKKMFVFSLNWTCYRLSSLIGACSNQGVDAITNNDNSEQWKKTEWRSYPMVTVLSFCSLERERRSRDHWSSKTSCS